MTAAGTIRNLRARQEEGRRLASLFAGLTSKGADHRDQGARLSVMWPTQSARPAHQDRRPGPPPRMSPVSRKMTPARWKAVDRARPWVRRAALDVVDGDFGDA
jgi:hypothetical protein